MSDAWRWADHRVLDAPEAHEGRALLFGAEHGGLFAIDAGTREVLARWRGRRSFALDDAPVGDREALDALRAARVLLPAAAPRPAPPTVPDPARFPLTTLVLEVAQACNLRCSYCYAGGGTYGGEARLMRPELAARAARRLVEDAGDAGQVTLVLFGGEPLMNLPAVRAAVLAGEEAARQAGKRLVVSLTTNGTRFTPAALDFLAGHGVGITVSIDGPPDIHDANRRHAGGRRRGSYAGVVAGLAALRARLPRPPAARVTLTPEQWPRIPEVFAHVLGLGVLEVGIAPASPVTPDLLPTPAQEAALIEGFRELSAQFEREAAARRVLPFSNLLDLLARLHVGRVRPAACGAGLGYLAMDAAGRYFLCHRFAGEARFQAGDLDSGIDHNALRACLAARAAPRRAACARCWARSLCAGGCYYENHLREERLGLQPGGHCDFIRAWLETGMHAYARLRDDPEHPVLALLARRADS